MLWTQGKVITLQFYVKIVDILKKQDLEQNKPLKKECLCSFFFFFLLTLSKNMVLISHIVFSLFVCFLQAALQPLNHFFFSFFSACGTCHHHRQHCVHGGSAVICFGFYTRSTTDCFTKLQTFLEGNTHFTFWTVLYWAKAGHRFTMYFRFLLFSKGTTL